MTDKPISYTTIPELSTFSGFSNSEPSDSYMSATGKIRYTFTNDLMFKICLQNETVLTAFLCALLDLSPDEIQGIQVNDPYRPGATVKGKRILLDISLVLNRDVNINIELQIINYHNWQDRSLTYLCRKFDQLKSGEEYINTLQCIHISVLDFTLFPKYPEFYAKYRLMNLKNHNIYNDKFMLNVLDLKQISLATEEEKARGLDKWAAIFKATTWEEVKTMTENNPAFQQMAQELYRSNSDESVRNDLQLRADFAQQQRWLLKQNEEKDFKLAEQDKQLAEQNKQLVKQKKQLDEQSSLIAALQAELAALKSGRP